MNETTAIPHSVAHITDAKNTPVPLSSFAPAHTLIVGSAGRMGQMLIKRAESARLKVTGIDLPYAETELKEVCRDAEAVILCVPAAHLEESLEALTPYFPSSAILADITSVKEMPMRVMEKYWSGPVVGTHPLFGPSTPPDALFPVVVVAGSNAKTADLQKISGFFSTIGCQTIESTAEKHDKAMAKIQNMNFITNLAYFAMMANEKDLLPFLTPSFERRRIAASKMLTEDAEMFSGLFEANEHSQEAVRQYRRILNIAASGDIELLLKKARWWWDQDGSKIQDHKRGSPSSGCYRAKPAGA